MATIRRSTEGSTVVLNPVMQSLIPRLDWRVSLTLTNKDTAEVKHISPINQTPIIIPDLPDGSYDFRAVATFHSDLDPTFTSEKVEEGTLSLTGGPTPTTPSTTPASGTTFGSALGVPFDFELELNGNPFSTTFERKVTTDLVSRLNNAATLKTELTFFLIGKGSITQEISRKFLNPDIGIDLELARVAGEIISKTQSLDKEIKSTQDITLFSSPDNEKLRDELATVILAYNVEFPPGTKAPPISAIADPVLAGLIKGLLEDEIIYKESSAVEDETKQIQKQAEKLTLFLEKDKHDMQGLLTIIQNPINKDNAIKLRDVFINQLGHFKKDITDTINESKKLGFLRPNLAQFKGIQEKMSSYSKKEEIKADTSFTEDKFITSAGKKLLSSYNSKIKSANDIIDEHNSLIDGIKNELDQIDLDKIDAELVKLAGLDKLLTVFTTWIPKAIENLNMLKTQEEIEKIPNMITSDVISHLQSASEIFNKDRVSVAEVLEDIKKVNKTIGDITTITRKKGSTAHGISAWFSRKSASLDSAVSDLKTLEIKMRELLSAGTTKSVAVTTELSVAPAEVISNVANAEVKVNVTTKGGEKGTSGRGVKVSGTGGRRPSTVTPIPQGPEPIIVDLADHEFYRKLKSRTSDLLTDWSLEMVEIYKKGRRFHQRLDFDKTYNMKFMNQTIRNLDRFVKAGKTAVNLTQLESDVRGLHAAFTNFREAIGKETVITLDEKSKFKGLTQRVENDLIQLEKLLQEEEQKLAATRTAAASAIGPPTGTPANVT